MKLENQVISLELAKKLKELGVRKESYLYWGYFEPAKRWDVIRFGEAENWEQEDGVFSAFTVAELGEMLPESITRKKEFFGFIVLEKENDEYFVGYKVIFNDKVDTKVIFNDKSEANARAKMLIYLIANGLIKSQ